MPAKIVMAWRQGGLQKQNKKNENFLCIRWTCFDVSNSWLRGTSIFNYNDLFQPIILLYFPRVNVCFVFSDITLNTRKIGHSAAQSSSRFLPK